MSRLEKKHLPMLPLAPFAATQAVSMNGSNKRKLCIQDILDLTSTILSEGGLDNDDEDILMTNSIFGVTVSEEDWIEDGIVGMPYLEDDNLMPNPVVFGSGTVISTEKTLPPSTVSHMVAHAALEPVPLPKPLDPLSEPTLFASFPRQVSLGSNESLELVPREYPALLSGGDEEVDSIPSASDYADEDYDDSLTSSLDLQIRLLPYQQDQWSIMYDQLDDFRRTNGHCLVPYGFQGNPALARWVKRQRYQYKLLFEGGVAR